MNETKRQDIIDRILALTPAQLEALITMWEQETGRE